MRRRSRALIAIGLLHAACGSDSSVPSAPTQPSTPTFDVQLAGSTPSSGATLDVASPNDTPVSLSVTFSVTVPPGEAGDYLWITAVQTNNLYGVDYLVPVVTTSPTQVVRLAAGTQTVTMAAFHTTNALCDGVPVHPFLVGTSTSLDVQLKTATFAPFFGKRFATVFGLRCVDPAGAS